MEIDSPANAASSRGEAPDVEHRPADAAGHDRKAPSIAVPEAQQAPAARSRMRPRWLAGTLAISLLLHLVLAAVFLVSRVGGYAKPIEIAGKKGEGEPMAGIEHPPAQAPGATDPQAVRVTLVPPPRQPTERKQATPSPAPKPVVPQHKSPAPPPILTAKAAGDGASPRAAPAHPPSPPAKPNVTLPAPAALPKPAARPSRPAPPAPVKQPAQAGASPPSHPAAGLSFGMLNAAMATQWESADTGRAKTGAGNAAVSDYVGKVSEKLDRSLNRVGRQRSGGHSGKVRLRLLVDAAGKVTNLDILDDGGSSELAKAAIATVHAAAPFPPIPADAGRRQWSFTFTLGFDK